MKYCVKCGNPMDDAMQFCQKCGAKCVTPTDEANYPPQQDQDNYAEYWGLHYKDIESGNEIELTPDGVHIFHSKGMKQFRFDKTIPYTEIIDVNSVRATALKSGYLSIITATEGITGKATRQQLLFNQNTVLFTKKTEPEAERIYRAIEDICSAPPQSNSRTTFYESSHDDPSFSASLSNPAQPKKRMGCLIPVIALVVVLIVVFAMTNSDNSGEPDYSNPAQQSTQTDEKQAEDYEGDVFTAFWEGASDFFGVEYSDYKWTHTATSYICDYETSDGYITHYYLIKTAFETKNIYGQEVLHEVTARCYYVPDYSNTVYTTYLTLDGEVVSYDEETECWLMNMDGGGTPPVTSEKTTGIAWDDFLKAYNEIAAKDPEGNGYSIDAEIDGDKLEYSFPNGETLSVETSNSKHIIRIEYIYPATSTNDQTLIMHRWWVLTSIVSAVQYELHGDGWSNAVDTDVEKILADVALTGGTDEAKTAYQNGNALTSSDLENGILYTRYLDKDTELSHFIVYGYGE